MAHSLRAAPAAQGTGRQVVFMRMCWLKHPIVQKIWIEPVFVTLHRAQVRLKVQRHAQIAGIGITGMGTAGMLKCRCGNPLPVTFARSLPSPSGHFPHLLTLTHPCSQIPVGAAAHLQPSKPWKRKKSRAAHLQAEHHPCRAPSKPGQRKRKKKTLQAGGNTPYTWEQRLPWALGTVQPLGPWAPYATPWALGTMRPHGP